jgi:competence protein ComEA
VFLNVATLDDLRRLPGVGPKRAEAILTLRTQKGRFRSVEELMRVKGIGRSTMRKLRPLMRLDAPLDAPAASDAGVTAAQIAR